MEKKEAELREMRVQLETNKMKAEFELKELQRYNENKDREVEQLKRDFSSLKKE